MDKDIAAIIHLAANLTEEQLLELNKEIGVLFKLKQEAKIIEHSFNFNKGDIVEFIDNNEQKRYGVVVKKNQKTIQVVTTDSYVVKIPPTHLTLITKPSQKLLNFRKTILITHQDYFNALDKLGLVKIDQK